MRRGSVRASAQSLRLRSCAAPVGRPTTSSENQPPGVPPLRADRRAHAARRARGELLVPPPPGRLRVDRRARRRRAGRRPGLRRGLRLRRARPRAPRAWSASTPTPRRTSTRGCATARPTCASSATWSRRSPSRATPSSSCRRSSTSRTPTRCSSTSRRMLARRRRRLRLDAEPAHAGARRAPRSRATPGTCASTAPEEFRALCEAHFALVELLGLFHARKLRAHELAIAASAGTASTPALRPHQAVLRPLRAGDLRRATSRCAPSATSTARWTSWRCCAPRRSSFRPARGYTAALRFTEPRRVPAARGGERGTQWA